MLGACFLLARMTAEKERWREGFRELVGPLRVPVPLPLPRQEVAPPLSLVALLSGRGCLRPCISGRASFKARGRRCQVPSTSLALTNACPFPPEGVNLSWTLGFGCGDGGLALGVWQELRWLLRHSFLGSLG